MTPSSESAGIARWIRSVMSVLEEYHSMQGGPFVYPRRAIRILLPFEKRCSGDA
jgi:hypothetical protein